jgi:hypothetical protein
MIAQYLILLSSSGARFDASYLRTRCGLKVEHQDGVVALEFKNRPRFDA